jgi:hypothetical protein
MHKAPAAVGMMVVMEVGLACVQARQYTPTPPTIPQLRLPQNDAYQGSVIRGDLKPRFDWEPATANVDGIIYQLQISPDRSFKSTTIQMEIAQTSYQPDEALPVSMSPPVGQRYYWRVRACVEKQCSEYSRTWWINLGRNIKDFNGDGYSDVAVGTNLGEEATVQEPVAIYFGGPGTNVGPDPDAVLVGSALKIGFGSSLSPAGDFNGDGFADLLVGASSASPNGGVFEGTAFLYLGGAGPFDTVPDRTFSMGSAGFVVGSVATAGDVDSDGYSDILIGVPTFDDAPGAFLYFGEKSGSARPALVFRRTRPGAFGATASGVGDLNGDGYSDIVIGSASKTFNDATRGCAANVYLGNEGAALDTSADGIISGDPEENCSLLATAAGDVNGDGFADVLATTALGKENARIFLGGKALPIEPVATFQGQSLGSASVGDLNGDGADDVAIVELPIPTSGKVRIHLGRLGAQHDVLVPSSAGMFTGRMNTSFGWVVRGAGDINDDGFDDVLIGDPDNQLGEGGEGEMLLLFGKSGDSFASPDATALHFLVTTLPPHFGYSVAALERRTR